MVSHLLTLGLKRKEISMSYSDKWSRKWYRKWVPGKGIIQVKRKLDFVPTTWRLIQLKLRLVYMIHYTSEEEKIKWEEERRQRGEAIIKRFISQAHADYMREMSRPDRTYNRFEEQRRKAASRGSEKGIDN